MTQSVILSPSLALRINSAKNLTIQYEAKNEILRLRQRRILRMTSLFDFSDVSISNSYRPDGDYKNPLLESQRIFS
jgi:hypothetical protein